MRTAANTVDVRGSRCEEATKTAQDFIERSIGAGRERVYVLHGTARAHSSGRAIGSREQLVRKFEPGNSDEGGDGGDDGRSGRRRSISPRRLPRGSR